MIRLNKSVKLLEWGEGTSTKNQVWSEMAEGRILSAKRKEGLTTMVVEVKGDFVKKNPRDDSVKVAQVGEGMAPLSRIWGQKTEKDMWGEVAMGRLTAVSREKGKFVVSIEISTATKISSV